MCKELQENPQKIEEKKEKKPLHIIQIIHS